jgi:uncharacterized protein YlaN (UPF0358 family)
MTKPEILALVGKTVEILKPPFEDGYLDVGQFADVVGITVKEEGTRDEYYNVVFDLTRFEEWNRAHEQANWQNPKTRQYDAKPSEVGCYPKNNRDSYYLTAEDIAKCLRVTVSYPITLDKLNLPRLPQRQDSLTDQMRDLRAVAVKLGLWDADDWIKTNFFKL